MTLSCCFVVFFPLSGITRGIALVDPARSPCVVTFWCSAWPDFWLSLSTEISFDCTFDLSLQYAGRSRLVGLLGLLLPGEPSTICSEEIFLVGDEGVSPAECFLGESPGSLCFSTFLLETTIGDLTAVSRTWCFSRSRDFRRSAKESPFGTGSLEVWELLGEPDGVKKAEDWTFPVGLIWLK